MLDMEINNMEKRWLSFWETEDIYKFNNDSDKKIYSIDTPPPTVSGEMHIGHAFSYSQGDFIARFMRMNGFNVFYPFGTDDNGLPTEKLIQKINKVKSTEMSKTDFITLCLKTLKNITSDFVYGWKRLGISCDYTKIYSTIDDNSRKISQLSFIDLYKIGLVYKKEFPVIWDVEFQTPVAQAELEDKEKESFIYTIKFAVDNNDILVATTRPELLGACVAIFVNPEDKRYKEFVGKKARVPLFNHEVKIIADSSANIEKGTGALMICSYGDKYDVDAIERYKLSPKIIINKDGTLNIDPYNGLEIKEARSKIVGDLKEKNLILEEKKIKHVVNVYEKSGKEIEFIPTEQWFIKILNKKKQLIEQGRKIKWYPDYMMKRYENWINGLEWDWSISRERHFGVPIPVWFCRNCNETILAEESELPVEPVKTRKICKKCKKIAEPETKVLDTWATSSLTPKIASSLIANRIRIPYDLRFQGHDIIRTWAFYTIVKSLYHDKNIPWKNIMISGFVKMDGEKMSKSKGNIINPREIIEKYGADALRYSAASFNLGEDMDYDEKNLIIGKRFVTKILNATNFVFINIDDKPKRTKIYETDRLFLVQLNKIIKTITEYFKKYNFAKAKLEMENFFWKIFADNYLEIVKKRVYDKKNDEKRSALYVLYETLFTIIKLFAPITPFVTEEIYQKYFRKYENYKSIHLSSWPDKINVDENKDDEKKWNKILEIITRVRKCKSEAKKSMKAEILLTMPKSEIKFLLDVLDDIKAVTSTREIKEGNFEIEIV